MDFNFHDTYIESTQTLTQYGHIAKVYRLFSMMHIAILIVSVVKDTAIALAMRAMPIVSDSCYSVCNTDRSD